MDFTLSDWWLNNLLKITYSLIYFLGATMKIGMNVGFRDFDQYDKKRSNYERRRKFNQQTQ